MRNKTILFISFLIASGSALAGQSLLEGATKQLVKDAATSAAPEAVQGAETAGQAIEAAKVLKAGVGNAPEMIKEQAQESAKNAVKQKIDEATPAQAKQGIEALKNGKETAETLKSTVENVPQAPSEAATAIKGKATEKVLDLLN